MKKQNSIIIISLISITGIFGVVYATSVSDTGIITPSCTGCSGEGTFTSYSNIFNNTISGTNIHFISNLFVGNDKSILVYDTSINGYFINSTQQVISSPINSGAVTENTPLMSQSSTGKYKVAFNDATDTIIISKGDSILQSIGINTSQFSDGTNLANEGLAISNDGKYIAIFGLNVGSGIDRLIIYQGS